MIQSAYKPVELKAPESVKPSVKPSETNKVSKFNAEKRNEFKSELKSATSSSEPKVKKVEVSEDQALRKPSSLINEEIETGNPESVSPKVFDPALTKDVQTLIDPQVTDAEGLSPEEILKLQSKLGAEVSPETAELDAALLKLPQVQVPAEGGRAPSIDFAATEVDPQLMSMEDFVAQKNMVNKKAQAQNAYGMKPSMKEAALEADLKSTEVVKDISMLENSTSAGTGSSVNSQQFILNNLAEQSNAKTGEVAQVKTFDMSQIKTADADKIMNQISDYIVQAKAAKEPTVNMRVNHQELGMIDITVMKSGGPADAVAISIGTHSADGKNFFQQNSKDLFSHLSSAGINVADLKVENTSNNAKSDFDFNQQSQKHSASGEKQFGSEQNQRRHEQDRRAELWKLFNKEAA